MTELEEFLRHLIAKRQELSEQLAAYDERIKEVTAEVERGGQVQVQTCRIRSSPPTRPLASRHLGENLVGEPPRSTG